MKKNGGGTVLITGASGGIGFELARRFARGGCKLILISRSKEKLEQNAAEIRRESGAEVSILAKDLSKPGAPAEIFWELSERMMPVDILVNNAGAGVYGFFKDTDLSRETDIIELNVTALTQMCKLFLPSMMKRRNGKILNVASTAAFQAGPLMAVYFATKAYVLSFTEAIANELKGTGVSASVLCPGPTASDFQTAAGIDRDIKLFKLTMMGAAEVADAGYRGLMKGKTIIIPGVINKTIPFWGRLLPRKLLAAFVRFFQEKKA